MVSEFSLSRTGGGFVIPEISACKHPIGFYNWGGSNETLLFANTVSEKQRKKRLSIKYWITGLTAKIYRTFGHACLYSSAFFLLITVKSLLVCFTAGGTEAWWVSTHSLPTCTQLAVTSDFMLLAYRKSDICEREDLKEGNGKNNNT